jgi:DNA-binding NarL/FixJ family response regulator
MPETIPKKESVDGRPRLAAGARVPSAESEAEMPFPKERDAPCDHFGLTRRERVVAGKLVAGYTNKEIAGDLVLSEKTVQSHVAKILDKLGVSNRLEGVLFIVYHQLIDPR